MKYQNTSKSKYAKAMPLMLIGSAISTMMVAGMAHAQWSVVDKTGNTHLDNIKGALGGDKKDNVNGNLAKLYKQQQIGKHKSSGDMAKDPEEKLDPDNPSEATVMGVAQRCPQSLNAQGVARNQQKLCEEIVKTELAQYKYSLKMYETAKERNKRLQEIENERQGIGANEQGKLQDNSNKLLALLSRMEIDRQQQKTYMDAYEARLRYLVAARDTLTQQALGGKAGAVSLAPVIGAGVMKAAFEAAKTQRRYNNR